jgi:hypothetical protein
MGNLVKSFNIITSIGSEGRCMQTMILWLNELLAHDFLLFRIGKNEFTLSQLLTIAIAIQYFEKKALQKSRSSAA